MDIVRDRREWSGLKHGPARPGPLALNAARPGLKRGPAAHTVLRNSNATSHTTSKRRPPPGLVYYEVKLTTVGMPT